MTRTTATELRLKTLVTEENIRKAINQARGYAIERGCQFAAVTNGHQWIFFKTFAPQLDWLELNAFVVPNLHYFRSTTAALRVLSYDAIVDQLTFPRIVGGASHQRAAFPYEGTHSILQPGG